MTHSDLFKEFPPVSTADWEAKIHADLKGGDYSKKLIWKSPEGIHVKPYYRSEDLQDLEYLTSLSDLIAPGSDQTDWLICEDITWSGNPEDTKQKADLALSKGSRAVTILFPEGKHPGKDALRIMLEPFKRKQVELRFSGILDCEGLWKDVTGILKEEGDSFNTLGGSLGCDPLSTLARKGRVDNGDFIFKSLSNILEERAQLAPGFRVLEVNAGLFQDAGSTLVEELGFGLSAAVEYMDRLTDLCNDPSVVAGAMQFNFCVGANYFMEIAKLRAARILWKRICVAYGIPEDQHYMPIHASTAEWNLTLYDPHVNMLRGTTEAMSAILGGADSLTVRTYDHPYGQASAFSERIARNTQIILKEEAYFNKVIDPAAGSYYIESLTDSMIREAWALFQSVEEEGGYVKAFLSGAVKNRINAARDERMKRVSQRQQSILGTNQYPNFSEMILDKMSEIPAGDMETPDPDSPVLKPFRAAALFESLRLETEQSSKRPKVYLLKFGSPAWMTARAMFSGNFFASAGYEIIDPPGVKDIDKGIQAAGKAGADVVVICSSDDQYPVIAPKIYAALQDRAEIVVAGYPKDSMDQLKALGIKHFIHMKTNLLDALQEFNRLLLT